MIKFTAYDVKEKVSQTAVPLGSAEIALGVIQVSGFLWFLGFMMF